MFILLNLALATFSLLAYIILLIDSLSYIDFLNFAEKRD